LLQRSGLKLVIHPTALLAADNQARLPHHPEVKGEFRLGKPQIAGEIADAALTIGKGFGDLQSQGISKSL
jgi:hypothetical protein